MLYISRYVRVGGGWQYGVVDTDDGKEQFVKPGELTDIMVDTDIEIAGVDIDDSYGFRDIVGIHVVQPEETVSRNQFKTRMIGHVDIKIYKTMITNIIFDGSEIDVPVRLRLSDYALSCADGIFTGNDLYGSHKITIVLDDHILFGREAFSCAFTSNSPTYPIFKSALGVCVDVTEVSNEFVRLAYDAVKFGCSGDINGMRDTVIDSEERKSFYLGAGSRRRR